jgi:hypothetical protein
LPSLVIARSCIFIPHVGLRRYEHLGCAENELQSCGGCKKEKYLGRLFICTTVEKHGYDKDIINETCLIESNKNSSKSVFISKKKY